MGHRNDILHAIPAQSRPHQIQHFPDMDSRSSLRAPRPARHRRDSGREYIEMGPQAAFHGHRRVDCSRVPACAGIHKGDCGIGAARRGGCKGTDDCVGRLVHLRAGLCHQRRHVLLQEPDGRCAAAGEAAGRRGMGEQDERRRPHGRIRCRRRRPRTHPGHHLGPDAIPATHRHRRRGHARHNGDDMLGRRRERPRVRPEPQAARQRRCAPPNLLYPAPPAASRRGNLLGAVLVLDRLVPLLVLRHDVGGRDVLPIRPPRRRGKAVQRRSRRDGPHRERVTRHVFLDYVRRSFRPPPVRQVSRGGDVHSPAAPGRSRAPEALQGHEAGPAVHLGPWSSHVRGVHVPRAVCHQLPFRHDARLSLRPTVDHCHVGAHGAARHRSQQAERRLRLQTSFQELGRHGTACAERQRRRTDVVGRARNPDVLVWRDVGDILWHSQHIHHHPPVPGHIDSSRGVRHPGAGQEQGTGRPCSSTEEGWSQRHCRVFVHRGPLCGDGVPGDEEAEKAVGRGVRDMILRDGKVDSSLLLLFTQTPSPNKIVIHGLY